MYELVAKYPSAQNNFCAGYNEFPVFNNQTNRWLCACKSPRSQVGCVTSSSMGNQDSSVSIYYTIGALLLLFLVLILLQQTAQYCWNLWNMDAKKERSVAIAVKRVFYFVRSSSSLSIVFFSSSISRSFSAS